MGCAVLFCRMKWPVPEKDRRSGKMSMLRIDRDGLRLGQVLVLLEVPLVGGADIAAVLGGEVLVEDVRIVVVPDAAPGGDEEEEPPRQGSDAERAAERGGCARAIRHPRRAGQARSDNVARKQEMESQ